MAMFDFRCPSCNSVEEVLVREIKPRPCEKCGADMFRIFSGFPMIHIRGMGLPARRKWMDNWTPESASFQDKVSVHGAPYESKKT